MALIMIGEDIVNTDAIVVVKKLSRPLHSKYDGGVVTHVVELREDVKNNFVRDMFVNERDLQNLYDFILKQDVVRVEDPEEPGPVTPIRKKRKTG